MEKPTAVTNGIKYLWLGVLAGVIAGILALFHINSHAQTQEHGALIGTGIVSIVIVVLVNWLFIHFIGKGKNWARVIYLVIFIIWALMVFMGGAAAIEIRGLTAYIITVVEFILLLVGIIMLFSSNAKAWFKQTAKADTKEN